MQIATIWQSASIALKLPCFVKISIDQGRGRKIETTVGLRKVNTSVWN
jgi:hypothetical protein